MREESKGKQVRPGDAKNNTNNLHSLSLAYTTKDTTHDTTNCDDVLYTSEARSYLYDLIRSIEDQVSNCACNIAYVRPDKTVTKTDIEKAYSMWDLGLIDIADIPKRERK